MVVLFHFQLLDHLLVHLDLFVEGARDCCDFGFQLRNLLNMHLVLGFESTPFLAFLLDFFVKGNFAEDEVLVELFGSVGHFHEGPLFGRKGHFLAGSLCVALALVHAIILVVNGNKHVLFKVPLGRGESAGRNGLGRCIISDLNGFSRAAGAALGRSARHP